MGLNAVVDSVVYKKDVTNKGDRLSFLAHVEPTALPQGTLSFDPSRSEVLARWTDMMKITNGSVRDDLTKALRIVGKSHGKYEQIGRMNSWLGIRKWTVGTEEGLTVSFYELGGNDYCDRVTVQLLNGAGKVFTIDMIVEDGVSTFVDKALAYLKPDKQDVAPTPVATPLARKPVVSDVTTFAMKR